MPANLGLLGLAFVVPGVAIVSLILFFRMRRKEKAKYGKIDQCTE